MVRKKRYIYILSYKQEQEILILFSKFLAVYAPLPSTFSEESQLAQLERMRLLDMQPITGLPGSKK